MRSKQSLSYTCSIKWQQLLDTVVFRLWGIYIPWILFSPEVANFGNVLGVVHDQEVPCIIRNRPIKAVDHAPRYTRPCYRLEFLVIATNMAHGARLFHLLFFLLLCGDILPAYLLSFRSFTSSSPLLCGCCEKKEKEGNEKERLPTGGELEVQTETTHLFFLEAPILVEEVAVLLAENT